VSGRPSAPGPGLYHFTCGHGRQRIGPQGWLLPAATVAGRRAGLGPQASYVWLTDLDTPVPGVLGLTSSIIACDRTQYRYRVISTQGVMPWTSARQALDPRVLEVLEAPPALLRHWWVARVPVRAVLTEWRSKP
jgi:hypothetical protein